VAINGAAAIGARYSSSCAIVQQRYGDALRAGVEPARRIVLWGGAALAMAALGIAGASVVMINRRAGGTR
jgi:hypothetical protein